MYIGFQTPYYADHSLNIFNFVQINGSLARAAIKELLNDGAIRIVAKHSKQEIYTRATNTEA